MRQRDKLLIFGDVLPVVHQQGFEIVGNVDTNGRLVLELLLLRQSNDVRRVSSCRLP